MARRSTLRRVRSGCRNRGGTGFIVTWDVNSVDRTCASRLQYFMFGHAVTRDGKPYVYPGFVGREGVRYLGQSVLFVRGALLCEVEAFLTKNGIDHEAMAVTIR